MNIFRIYQESRTHGKLLPETGYQWRYVEIYRAVAKPIMTINHMDYVTRSIKFAKEHADHMMWTTEEDQHVIRAMVKSKDVAEASNPGEYFYVNQNPVDGKEIYEAKFREMA